MNRCLKKYLPIDVLHAVGQQLRAVPTVIALSVPSVAYATGENRIAAQHIETMTVFLAASCAFSSVL